MKRKQKVEEVINTLDGVKKITIEIELKEEEDLDEYNNGTTIESVKVNGNLVEGTWDQMGNSNNRFYEIFEDEHLRLEVIESRE